MIRAFSTVFLLLWSVLLFAQVRGPIARGYVARPAVDLVYKGRVLLPDEAHQLWLDSRKRFDLSTLDPAPTTDLWKNEFPARIQEADLDYIPVDAADTVTYHSNVLSRSGIARFNITRINEAGVPEIYTVQMSLGIHAQLMAKGLLRKIGYKVPAMKWLPQLKVKFANADEKRTYINFIEKEQMLGDASNWIVEEYNDNTVLFQDVMVMESINPIFNMATAPITQDLEGEIGGRRIMSGLVVPLALTNFTSVNMLGWNVGSIIDDTISLQIDNAEVFGCSWEDARWIARRIERLSRGDWEDIVASSQVPKLVQMVLIERMISRRNDLMRLFEVDAVPLKVDGHLNGGADVIDGKIVRDYWDGYASRFAFGDPDSPMSDGEMASWMKSKGIQVAIDSAVSYVNSMPALGTDTDAANQKYYQKYLDDYVRGHTGDAAFHAPIKGWVFPTARGNLVLTRNITTGTYLGTDSMVNLVDAIGATIEVGAYGGVGGIPTPFNVSGKASVTLSRVYAHLRPVTSLTKALKYPFKNMLVPMVKREYGKKLNAVLNLDPDKTSEDELQDKIGSVLKDFKDNLDIGESLIITDSFIVSAQFRAGVNYQYWMKAQLGIGPKQLVVARFHIHRRSEDVLQIYRDFGNVSSAGLNFGLDSLLPVTKLEFKLSKGSARTKFFTLDLEPKTTTVEQIASIREAMLSSSLKKLEKEQKPWVLRHKFDENEQRFGIFFWRWNHVNSHTDMDITHPEGATRTFSRSYMGQTNGQNYQEFALDAVRNWLSLFANFDYNSSDSSDGNPGYSYKGNATNKILTYEGETTGGGALSHPFLRMNRIWNGWEIDRKGAQRILDEIRNRYAFSFYSPNVLNDTVKIYLYTIAVNILVYDSGVDAMANLPDDEVKRVFSRSAMRPDLRIRPVNEEADVNAAKKFLRHRRSWLKARATGNNKKASEEAMKTLELAEEKLNLEGLRAILGGEDNFYVVSKITGYRTGDENGDRAIMSNAFGEYGRREVLGPLQPLVDNSEMLEGEFFIYWLMTRLI